MAQPLWLCHCGCPGCPDTPKNSRWGVRHPQKVKGEYDIKPTSLAAVKYTKRCTKLHKFARNRLRLGLRPRSRWGNFIRRSPRPLVGWAERPSWPPPHSSSLDVFDCCSWAFVHVGTGPYKERFRTWLRHCTCYSAAMWVDSKSSALYNIDSVSWTAWANDAAAHYAAIYCLRQQTIGPAVQHHRYSTGHAKQIEWRKWTKSKWRFKLRLNEQYGENISIWGTVILSSF